MGMGAIAVVRGRAVREAGTEAAGGSPWSTEIPLQGLLEKQRGGLAALALVTPAAAARVCRGRSYSAIAMGLGRMAQWAA